MNHTAEQIAEQLPQSSLENAGELAEGAVANFADGIISGIDEADYEDADGSFIELNRAINYALKKESGQPVDDLELTKPYMRARKDFALAVIGNLGARFAAADDAQDMEAVETLAEKLETSLLGGAPNILNYVGDFDDSLDVAVAAQEVPVLRRATWEITEHAMQRITFASDPEAWSQSLEDKVLQASPIRQLQLLKFYESMSQHATAAGYGEEAAHILLAIFEDISQSGTALTGLVAAGYAVDVEDRFMNQRALTGNACTEITQWEKYGLSQYFQLPENIAGLYSVAHIARDTLGLRDQWGTIRSLAKMPDIPQELSGDRLVLSNVMQWFDHAHPEATVPNRATVDWLTRNLEDESIKQAISHAHTGSERLDVINQASGKSIAQPRSVTDIEPLGKVVGEQGIKNLPSEEATALLQTIHQPEVREMLEDFLGISLAELNLQSQLYLLQYVVERSPAEFSRLTHAAERLGGGASSIYWSNVGVSERKTYVSSTEFQPVSRVDFY
ncbi:MAG: hypothetical protein ACREGA_01995, partial [Candidatus Saccharimonadales bacterium]